MRQEEGPRHQGGHPDIRGPPRGGAGAHHLEGPPPALPEVGALLLVGLGLQVPADVLPRGRGQCGAGPGTGHTSPRGHAPGVSQATPPPLTHGWFLELPSNLAHRGNRPRLHTDRLHPQERHHAIALGKLHPQQSQAPPPPQATPPCPTSAHSPIPPSSEGSSAPRPGSAPQAKLHPHTPSMPWSSPSPLALPPLSQAPPTPPHLPVQGTPALPGAGLAPRPLGPAPPRPRPPWGSGG